jgi:rhamnulokinase
VGVPADGGSWAFLSSGTWSLLGVELPEPIINDAARQLNFTNEIGFGNTVRLLKNLSGMWLVQECRREWRRQGRDFDYARLTEMAEAAAPFRSIIDPGAGQFLAPENMPHEIAEFCRRTGQPVPENEGAFVRCAFDSLALLYRRSLRQIETLIGRKIDRLHVVGGGSNNSFLNQLTADVLEIPVIAGPAEATAAGNIVIQAMALGQLDGLEQARALIRASTQMRRLEPRPLPGFAGVVERFEKIC